MDPLKLLTSRLLKFNGFWGTMLELLTDLILGFCWAWVKLVMNDKALKEV